MFSVEQKRDIANKIQQILRDTGHPELPVTEIEFMLYVHGRFQWAWTVIQNNSAVPIPPVNPWNEAQVQNCIPAKDQHGREPGKMKPLAQYLGEYVDHELAEMKGGRDAINWWRKRFEQALDAYQSTENIKIRIERI